ncbi:MAG: hypothetical protein ACTSRI_11245 [Promethearchaeota archaeon]
MSNNKQQSKSTKVAKKTSFSLDKSLILRLKIELELFYKDLKKLCFPKDVLLKGQEPPKFYSFEKKFFGLYGIFIFYSFLSLLAINFPDNPIIYILTIGNPFIFGNAILFFFLIMSILLSVDKIRIYIFEEKTVLKQIMIYCGIIFLLYLFFFFVFKTDINLITFFSALAMIWLIILSSRFYMTSRKLSTKIESRFISKYSIPRYLTILIVPFVILGVLVIISIFYRSFLVFIALDFFGPNNPEGAVDVYNLEMRLIMPLIYFSLVMTLVFIIFEFVFTRRRAETKRAGSFDNFTFSLIVLFIFFFQIFQMTIFLLLRPETVSALKATVGATSTTLTFIFIFEFAVSMVFLYRVISKLGRTFGWRVLFFKKDGLIVFFLACVFAQTLTRFSLSSEIPNQELTIIGSFLMADKYVISVLMIILLGLTLLIYYLKPHETSMFMRLQKETVNEEEKSMEQVYKIIKNEYIRRGEAYPLEILERELIKATKLSKAIVYSLIKRLVDKDINMVIIERKNDQGKMIKLIDFLSVTEQFEKKDGARKKAQRFLSEKLIEATSIKEKTMIKFNNNLKSDKVQDKFISSLASDFTKKQADKQQIEKIQKETQISFKKDRLTEVLKNQILQIIKKKYMYRIENLEKYPDFYMPISEITYKIQLDTKISPGELYPILEELNKTDSELELIENPDEPEDKKIRFLCIDDDMCYSMASFRPKQWAEIVIYWTINFLKALKTKKTNAIIANLKRAIKEETDEQKSWFKILTCLYTYYPEYEKQLKYIPNRIKLLKLIDNISKLNKM